jgi:predicted negative regulator of RcsB-dependent stress response
MAVYDLEEQEQLDELKTWWKRYGNVVTGILFAAAVGLAAWQGWNWWQRNQAVQASAVFSGLQQAAGQGDAKRVRELAGELIDKYSGTSYAGMGALVSARIQVDRGDAKNAQVQLAWAAEHARDAGLRELARLRLALVLLDEKSYDAALKQLAIEPSAPFAARYAELRGDILAAQGKLGEAVAAYALALEKVDAMMKKDEAGAEAHAAYREVLQSKHDALGAGK